MIMANTYELIQQYFKGKTQQLLSLSEQAICEHNGLKGSHREEIIKIYLQDILPKRFDVGKGMIYGPFSRSHETDIVLWDTINFPSLTLLGHNMFFIESVVAAIEVKSNYDKSIKADILQKTEDLNGIIQNYVPTYDERIFGLEARMYALENSLEFEGNLKSGKRVKSIAIIINGGENINKSFLDDIDDIFISCPNLMIFLNAGKVVVKLCEDNKHFVRIYNAKEDALLIFTQHLINIISEQVVLVEGKLFLEDYIAKIIDSIEYIDVEYGCIYPDDYRKPIFSDNNNKSPRG